MHDLPASLASFQGYPDCLGDWTQAHADRLSAGYLQSLQRMAPGAQRVTNKHLDNWRQLGMVALLFPGARVVHCSRHPVDNGLSIFMAAMNSRVYPWSTDLADIGFAYRQYERLMRHWHETLDLEILDVQYEDLVADPEPWIRRIIEFTGLPWDDQCLRFHESTRDVMTLSYDQVRRPIYASAVKRYEKYRAHLGPLEQALSEADEAPR